MSFINDKGKMRNFEELSKDEFLKSYSYITGEKKKEKLKNKGRKL